MIEYNFENSIARISRIVSLQMGEKLVMEFKKKGIKINSYEYVCLGYISSGNFTTQKSLTEVTGLNKVRIKRIVDRLIVRNLVISKENKSDKRVLDLSITRQGKVLFSKLKTIAANVNASTKNDINEEDIKITQKVLLKIIENTKL